MTRQEASKILTELWGCDYYYCLSINDATAIDMALEALKQPEQKRGKWIRCENPTYSSFDDSDQYTYRCTVCYKKNGKQTKYCPNCGALLMMDNPSHPFADDVMMEE